MTDNDLRHGLAVLAEQARPTDLYERSLARSRQLGRRRGAVAAAGVAVAVVGVLGLVTQVGRPSAESPASTWDSAFAAQCANWWQGNAGGSPVVSDAERAGMALQFAFRDGEEGLRLYTDGTLLFACYRGGDGTVTATLHGDGRTDQPFVSSTGLYPVPYLAVFNRHLPEFVIGTVPAKVDHVTVNWELRHAPEPATVHNGYFADWSAHGGMEDTWITGDVRQGGVVGTDGDSWPSFLGGDAVGDWLPEQCQRALSLKLSDLAVDRFNSIINVDPRRVTDGSRDYLFWGDAHVLTMCERDEVGQIIAATVIGQNDEPNAATAISAIDAHSWVFGRGRIDQTRVELVLADGRTIDAQVSGRFYTATWTTDGTDLTDPTKHGVVETRFYTPQGVYSNQGGTLHRIG